MKKNILIKGLMGVVLAGSMVSCSEDYLNTEPQMGISAGDVYATVDAARKGMYGVCRGMYNQWQGMDQGFNGEAFISNFYGETAGQDFYEYYWSYIGWNDQMTLDFAQVTDYKMCNYAWAYAYTLIGQANDVLGGIDTAEGDAQERNFVKAQLLTLRAHAYWRLLQVYAPRWIDSNEGNTECIVMRLEPTTGDAPLVTMKAVLDQMYADLNLAIELFENSGSIKRSFGWEPDLSVCYGTYARLALLKDDWATAQEMANKARANYPIMTADEYQAGFNMPNNEWMWYSSGELADEIYYWAHGVIYACNGYYACNQPIGAGAINIDTYRQIPEGDIRRNLYLTEDKVSSFGADKWYDPELISEVSISPKDDKVNTRNLRSIRNWAATLPQVAEHGFSLPYTAADVAESSGTIWQLGAQFKYWCLDTRGRGYVSFMRGAEMLLTEAEAAYHNDDEGTAKRLLEELNAQRNENYTCTVSGQALLDEIRFYRRIELLGEGFNWYDFKRWNLPIERRAWVANDPTSGNYPIVDAKVVPVDAAKGWRYAVPKSETDYNDAIK